MTDELLFNSIRDGKIMHALLFTGPDGGGRETFARRAAALYCLEQDAPEELAECPNFIEIGPSEKGVIEVNTVRTLNQAAAIRSFSGGRRVFFIREAHRMNTSAENALLKTLEEPPENTMLILEGRESAMLPTILSRCAIRRIGGTAPDTLAEQLVSEGFERKAAAKAARLSGGVPGKARFYLSDGYASFAAEANELIKLAVLARFAPSAEGRGLLEKDFFQDASAKKSKKKKADPGDDEEEADSGARKKAKMRVVLEAFLEYAQNVIRDALLLKEGIATLCPDASGISKKIAEVRSEADLMKYVDSIQNAYRANAEESEPARIMDILLLDLGEAERTQS